MGGTLEDLHGPWFKLKDIGARNQKLLEMPNEIDEYEAFVSKNNK